MEPQENNKKIFFSSLCGEFFLSKSLPLLFYRFFFILCAQEKIFMKKNRTEIFSSSNLYVNILSAKDEVLF